MYSTLQLMIHTSAMMQRTLKQTIDAEHRLLLDEQ